MTTILAFLATGLGKFVSGAALTGAGLALAKAALPKIMGREAGKLLERWLAPNSADAKRNALVHDVVIALVRLAEYEFPDRGSGAARYTAVADRLVALVPPLAGQGQKLAELIEAAVSAMDDELKAKSAEPPKP